MDIWSPIANALAWIVLVPIGYVFTVLYLMMFSQILFSEVEKWPENKWEWFEQCFVAGFAFTLLPFFLSFGHGSLHRLFTFRSPFAEGFFSFANLATFAVALAFAGTVAVIARRKYEKDKTELVLLCWPLLAILVAWFNFGSAVFL